MEDEKRRASVLFGDKFNKLNNQKHESEADEVVPVVPAAPVMAPSSYIQPQPIIIQTQDSPKDSLTRDDVQQEVRAALDEDKAAAEEQISLFERKYFSMIAGVPQYSNANGIQGNYSLGFNIGTTNNFLQVEVGFIYSNYLITDAQYVDRFNYVRLADFSLNQYQTFVATKIQLLDGDIRPSVGGLASYSFRKYVADSFTTYGDKGTDFGQSSAIDLGVTAGIDLALSQRFSLGADLKYMFNISSNINGKTSSNAASPEKLSYYLLGLTAKMMF
jgi:hypothetical protein